MLTSAVVDTACARLLRIPVVVNSVRSLGFLQYRHRRPVKRVVYAMSDCVIANSMEIHRHLLEHRLADPSKVRTIYNGVDLDRFVVDADAGAQTAKKRELGLSPAAFPIVGMIANLNPVKNHVALLQAAPTVLRKFPDAVFLIIGDGSLRERLTELAGRLGINRNVFFWVREATPANCCG
jgi:glycosyltransferase involved in cell wall biosynthesis